MEIKKLETSHFYELRDLLDGVFSRKYGRQTRFEKLFPRFFSEPNEYVTSSHLGAFEDGRLIGTAAMYPLDYVVGDVHVRLIGNGNVAVHEDFRGKGVMTAILHQINDACDVTGDLGYLHGDPVRYGRVGYVGGGREFLLVFRPGKKTEYTFRPACTEDAPILLALSHSRCDYIVRTEKDIIPALRSGCREAFSVCRKNGELIGYISLKVAEGEMPHVEEFAFAEECQREVFLSLAATLGQAVRVRLSGYDVNTLKKCESDASVTVSEPALFRIINADPLERAALSLGLEKNVLYAPYLT